LANNIVYLRDDFLNCHFILIIKRYNNQNCYLKNVQIHSLHVYYRRDKKQNEKYNILKEKK